MVGVMFILFHNYKFILQYNKSKAMQCKAKQSKRDMIANTYGGIIVKKNVCA